MSNEYTRSEQYLESREEEEYYEGLAQAKADEYYSKEYYTCENCGSPKESKYISCAFCGAEGQ